MPCLAIIAGTLLLGLSPGEMPPHQANPVYQALIDRGTAIEGTQVELSRPRLADGLSADRQRALLKELAGSQSEAEELARASVTAPFILKVHDEKTTSGDLIRLGDLWFVVHAGLDSIDPEQFAGRAGDSKPVEAGNMRFSSHLLKEEELTSRGISLLEPKEPAHEWYLHLTGRLLDRIHVEETDRVTASRSAESWIIASAREPRFDRDREYPNGWTSITGKATPDRAQLHPYPGGASYIKITNLTAVPGALLVESHFAFAEPRAWFDGAPILRSKIALVAQDRIRALRRDLAKSQKRH